MADDAEVRKESLADEDAEESDGAALAGALAEATTAEEASGKDAAAEANGGGRARKGKKGGGAPAAAAGKPAASGKNGAKRASGQEPSKHQPPAKRQRRKSSSADSAAMGEGEAQEKEVEEPQEEAAAEESAAGQPARKSKAKVKTKAEAKAEAKAKAKAKKEAKAKAKVDAKAAKAEAKAKAKAARGKKADEVVEAVPADSWFTVKKHVHLGLGLQLEKSYSAGDLRKRCRSNGAKLKKLAKCLQDPSSFEPVAKEDVAQAAEEEVQAQAKAKTGAEEAKSTLKRPASAVAEGAAGASGGSAASNARASKFAVNTLVWCTACSPRRPAEVVLIVPERSAPYLVRFLDAHGKSDGEAGDVFQAEDSLVGMSPADRKRVKEGRAESEEGGARGGEEVVWVLGRSSASSSSQGGEWLPRLAQVLGPASQTSPGLGAACRVRILATGEGGEQPEGEEIVVPVAAVRPCAQGDAKEIKDLATLAASEMLAKAAEPSEALAAEVAGEVAAGGQKENDEAAPAGSADADREGDDLD